MPIFFKILSSFLIILVSSETILSFFAINAPAITKVPASILSNITEWLTGLNFLPPIIFISLLLIHFILTPIFFKKFVKSSISGSHAQFLINVVPFA